MTENNTEKSSNLITGVIVIAILLAVLLLTLTLLTSSINTTIRNTNGITYTLVNITNETGYANTTGYYVTYRTATGFNNPAITKLFNRTSNTLILVGNATISSTGLVTNASATQWNNLSISYSYYYEDTVNNTAISTSLFGIQDNVISLVINFFALMPTIGTILAVVILIAVIVILVMYVMRMRGAKSENFSG